MALFRTGIALDSDLLKRFDRLIGSDGYNRSRSFRDLIRDRLNNVTKRSGNASVAGAITLIYNHRSRLFPDKLMDVQHCYRDVIISTVRSHLDHEMCLEVVMVKGKEKRVQELGSRLIGLKGVKHGRLVTTFHMPTQCNARGCPALPSSLTSDES